VSPTQTRFCSSVFALGMAACVGQVGDAVEVSSGVPNSGSSSGTSTGTGNSNVVSNAADSGTTTTPVNFTLSCDAPQIGSPTLRLLTRNELQNTLNDIFPEVSGQWNNSLPANTLSSSGFDNDASAQVGSQLAEELFNSAQSLAKALTSSALSGVLPCSSSAQDRSCAEQFVTKFGRRLFRRSISDAEKNRYLAYYDSVSSKSDFKTGIEWLTIGLIQSPHAIYRSELGTGDAQRTLTPVELATELAYTFSGTTPSEELLAQAESGNLGDLTELAKNLLETNEGKDALQRFFEGYLAYTRVASMQKANIPEFGNVTSDMVRETRAFIDNVVFQEAAGVKELFTANVTNLTPALAQYYGFPAPNEELGVVERPAGRGVGILAQGAFLATHANTDASSPTQRGVFMYLHAMCQPKLSPPPGVPQISSPQPGQRTTRQRYEDLHQKLGTDCHACHQYFDPAGFGFEHFDEGGRFRQEESGLPINTAATVLGPDGQALFSFDGQEDLMAQFLAQPIVYQCFSAHLATYAFGTAQGCLGSSNNEALETGAIGIADAYAALAAEPHFTTRRVP